MKLYFDCTSGVSGDMVLNALLDLGGDVAAARKLQLPGRHHSHDHDSCGHDHGHHSHRSHKAIKAMIEESQMPRAVKDTALSIYRAIAAGEAKVHGSTAEEVHFHEVGRDEAIRNITGIAAALESLDVNAVYCSAIHDGKGFIQCSHGTIPVPVPAVMAMRETCDDFVFVADDVKTEMVTPSGLGILIGIGARYSEQLPPGEIVKTAVAKGGRDTGREGLKAVLIKGA